MINDNMNRRLLKDLIPLIGRFPHFPVNNVSYNRNFVELISNLYAIDNEIALHLRELRPEKTLKIGARYIERDNCRYDSERLKGLALTLESNYQPLRSFFAEIGFSDIERDLVRLKGSDDFEPLAKKLIRISPLIYDVRGDALEVSSSIEALSLGPVELQARYTDTFQAHLAGIITALSGRKGFGEVHRYVRDVINQFIPREVIPATLLYGEEKTKVRERELVLEEIPPLYTPLRGALAGDCSMVSVPYFGILKNTRVFWVVRSASERARPGGYLFLAEIEREDRSLIPYIITINGPLISKVDCYAIFLLVGEMYPGNELLVADVKNVHYLVNSYQVEDAMGSLGGKRVKVELPRGWEEISRWRVNSIDYENFYSAGRISEPKLTVPENLPIYNVRISPPERGNFYPHTSPGDIKLINRAIIGYYFLRTPAFHGERESLRQFFNLNEEHLNNIRVLIDYYQTGRFQPADFEILKTHFDFTMDDYSNIERWARWESLGQIYRLQKDDRYITRAQWSAVCRKTFDEIRNYLEEDLYRDRKDEVLDLLASVPDEYIPEYWEIISPYFMINDKGDVDYYMLRRFVKHFHSYGTIEQFLQFLSDCSDAMEAVKPEDRRWSEFLERARLLMPESENLAELFRKIFYEFPLDPGINLDLYEISKRVEAGRGFGLAFTEDYIEGIIRNREWEPHREELMGLI